jgi:GNAT superfamily N-acetyltransferase
MSSDAGFGPEFTDTLRDGTRVLIRPIRPDDKDRLVAGLERLSPESRYRRFLRPVKELTDRELRYLTEIDYTNHYAIGALALDEPEGPGLGIARYVRDPVDPDVAEAAVAVVDDFQGKGLGSLLLSHLIEAARRNRISVFRAWVLAENRTVIDGLRALGAELDLQGGLLRIDFDLPEAFEGSPMQQALRAAAGGDMPVEPLR